MDTEEAHMEIDLPPKSAATSLSTSVEGDTTLVGFPVMTTMHDTAGFLDTEHGEVLLFDPDADMIGDADYFAMHLMEEASRIIGDFAPCIEYILRDEDLALLPVVLSGYNLDEKLQSINELFDKSTCYMLDAQTKNVLDAIYELCNAYRGFFKNMATCKERLFKGSEEQRNMARERVGSILKNWEGSR